MINRFSALDNISEKIKQRKCAIFCGAGVSLDSGLPIVSQLLRNMFEKMELSQTLTNKIIESNLPFEAIMATIQEEASINDILEVFEGSEPNTNHILLAKLVKYGYVNTICTTNFDLLIEKALIQENLIEGKDFTVCSDIEEFSKIDWESNIPKVIKIHGSIIDKEQVAITMQQVAGQLFSKARKDVINNIFSGSFFESILVMGYSCSDLFDITPHIEGLLTELNEVNIIDHKPLSIANYKNEDINRKELKNPFKYCKKGLRIYIDTAEIVKKVWQDLINDEYRLNIYSETGWHLKVNDWANCLRHNYPKGIKHHVCARLLYDIGEFKDSITLNKRAITIEQEEGNITALAAAMGNLGMGYSCVSKFRKAKAILLNSIKLSRLVENMQGEASQLGALAIVLHHMGDQAKAIECHKQSLKLYIQLDDEPAIGNVYGNMGNVYNAMAQYENAAEVLQEGLFISRKWGNKQAEGSQLGIIANSFYYLGRINEAHDCLLKSIAIKKMIGDRQGESMVLANISNLYIAMGNPAKALESSKASLGIAKIIENHQVEGIATFNIGNALYEMGEFNSAAKHYMAAIRCFELLYDDGNHFLESARIRYSMATEALSIK